MARLSVLSTQPCSSQLLMRDTVHCTVERDVPPACVDGTVLYADVYRSAVPGQYPVISLHTPYNKSFGRIGYLQLDPMCAAS
jgi:predicted acyl esterase